MVRLFPWILLALAAALCLAGSYGLRFNLMEADLWVGRCVDTPDYWACELRATLGWLIHTRALAWSALLTALLAFVLPERGGRLLAAPALLLGLPALVLYSASLAVFAVLLALLRLVRAPRRAAQAL
jgi:hypothetical protein